MAKYTDKEENRLKQSRKRHRHPVAFVLFQPTLLQGGLKYTLPGARGGEYLISGLGHKISCQTRNTIESLLKVKVARTRT